MKRLGSWSARARALVDDDRGIAAAELTVGLVIALVAFATLLNGAFVVYGKGVIRAALHEGVQAASAAPADAGQCEKRIASALDTMLGPYYRGGVSFGCSVSDTRVVAEATGYLPAFVPGVPDVTVQLQATAVKEQDPREQDPPEEA